MNAILHVAFFFSTLMLNVIVRVLKRKIDIKQETSVATCLFRKQMILPLLQS